MRNIDSAQEFSKTRDIDHDRKSIENRLERFRGLKPGRGSVHNPSNSELAEKMKASPGLPEVSASQLSLETLSTAINVRGGIIVRGLLERDKCKAYREVIDKVLDNASAWHLALQAGHTYARNPFHNPPSNLVEICAEINESPLYLPAARHFHRESGSAMSVESSGAAEQLLELYNSMALRDLISSYFNETPCISAQKWVLRRTLSTVNEHGWHQDGAFMGTDIKSLNMWISLSECGGNTGAPGMDIVPQKLDHIVSSEGGFFDWAANPQFQSDNSGLKNPVAPVFQEGDAIFFDHFNLHRTQHLSTCSRSRYAIETWFFGENSFPENQIPIAW